MLCGIALAGLLVSAPPDIPREYRGAWIATVDNVDWPSKRGLSSDVAQQELADLVSTAAQLKLNVLIFQVRPHGDALYSKAKEPWSEYLSGIQGLGPNPEFDPLQTLIDLAHPAGIQVVAWFNPFRVWHPKAMSQPSADSLIKTHPEAVVDYGPYKWLDPGQEFSRNWTLGVVENVVKRYDIDGVHIDDYFYPYPIENHRFEDSRSYGQYRAGGGKLDQGDWRRQNINRFVQDLGSTIHRVKPWVRFEISPFGIAKPGEPAGITAGVNQYSELFADPVLWLRKGWCDLLAPQLYWPISQAKQSFPRLLAFWNAQNVRQRLLTPGLFTSQLRDEPRKWKADEITSQIRLCRASTAAGHIHFSLSIIQQDIQGIRQRLADSCYQVLALAPATPWLDASIPPVARDVHWEEDRLCYRGESAAVILDSRQGFVQEIPQSGGAVSEIASASRLALISRTGILGPSVKVPSRP